MLIDWGKQNKKNKIFKNMGNNQSNTRTPNYKVFRISKKEEHSGWFRCYLDDYVSYDNSSEKRIDFENEIGSQTAEFIFGIISSPYLNGDIPKTPFLNKGDYIRVDMDVTREHSSSHNFSARSITKVGYESVDSDGNISIFGIVAGVTDDILQARQRHVAMAESARFQNQVLQFQTSYNLPPK